MRNFYLHSGLRVNAAGLPFRKARVPPAPGITRTPFIEMGLFPQQLLPETAKGAKHCPSQWTDHHSGQDRKPDSRRDSGCFPPLGRGQGRVGGLLVAGTSAFPHALSNAEGSLPHFVGQMFASLSGSEMLLAKCYSHNHFTQFLIRIW